MMNHFKSVAYLVAAFAISISHAGSYEDFFKAVNRDDGQTVQRLLERGFDPNARDPEGQTALHLALRDASPRTLDALLRSTAVDIDAHNAAGETPLMLAALKGDAEAVKRLLARGAKPHQDGWSPVHYAASGPSAALVRTFVELGAPVEARSPNGTTPLMMAAGYGSEGAVDYLLTRGADKAQRNDRGWTALDFAKAADRDFLLQRLTPSAPR